MLCRVSFAIASTILLGLHQESEGFSIQSPSLKRSPAAALRVASQDVSTETKAAAGATTQDDDDITESVPYAIARGDGSTGGGGLSMPRATEEEDGLVRPKVGAEMPVGRPDWFRVPAPSQGRNLLLYEIMGYLLACFCSLGPIF